MKRPGTIIVRMMRSKVMTDEMLYGNEHNPIVANPDERGKLNTISRLIYEERQDSGLRFYWVKLFELLKVSASDWNQF